MLGFSQSSAGACGPEGKGAQQRSLTACRMGGFWSAQVDIDFLCYGRGSEETGLQGFVKWPDVWKQECWNSLLDLPKPVNQARMWTCDWCPKP